MVRQARQDHLLRLLRTEGAISVTRCAAALGVTEMTIRRDLATMAAAGLVDRVHGGAVLPAPVGRPGRAARPALRIGMLVPRVAYYYGAVIKGAEAAATARGYRLIYGAHFSSKATEVEHLHRLGRLDLDGLIVTPGHETDGEGLTDLHLDEIDAPVVICERPLSFPRLAVERDRVASDHEFGATLGLRHLADLGHRRVTCASAPTATFAALDQGVRQANRDIGLALQNLGCALPWQAGAAQDAAIADLLAAVRAHGSTALFLHSDVQALTVLDAVLARRWRVPEDLTVLSYDDECAVDAAIPLSAVSPAKYELGARAVELLDRRIADHAGTAPIERVGLLPRLQVRASSGTPRAGRLR